MKKLIAFLLCICMIFPVMVVSAQEIFIELDSLRYDEYMRGETIIVTGDTNAYVTLGLYYPEHYGSSAKYIMTFSPEELSEGVSIETDTDDRLWPDGVWTIVVQNGDVAEALEFTLCEVVDRSEEETEPPTKPSGGGHTGSDAPTVVSIIPEKTKVSLTVDESETINIETSSSSLTLEIDDEDVVSAKLSGKTLTILALKRGTSDIWIKAGSNYATINVTVTPKTTNSSSDDTEEETEPATEPVTEPDTEPDSEPEVEDKPLPFTDVENHWAKSSIEKLYDMGIIAGMDEDTFAPDDFVTRAQFVTMLQKAFNLETKVPISPFTDVKTTDWYFSSVMAAYENGIANGYGGLFNPNSLVTRQDMAVFAHRAALNSGKTFTLTNITTFTDHSSISEYAVEAVYSMKSAAIINGMTNTTFEPTGNATRAQAAHIIAKLLDL